MTKRKKITVSSPECDTNSNNDATVTDEIIELNVSGLHIDIYKSVLLNAGESSVFNKMLAGEMKTQIRDKNGRIFLSRDPGTFQELLRYLSGYDVFAGKTSAKLAGLYHEADYFNIPELMQKINDLPELIVYQSDYTGGMKGVHRHAYGILKVPEVDDEDRDEDDNDGHPDDQNGYTYAGEFKYGKRHGKGTCGWEHGDTFQGEFNDDGFFCGVGKMYGYEGEFKANLRHGKGKWVYGSDGAISEGYFLDGVLHGQAKYIYPASAAEKEFEGEFKKGQRDGKGKLTYKDGRLLEGIWNAGKMDGAGTMFTPFQNR